MKKALGFLDLVEWDSKRATLQEDKWRKPQGRPFACSCGALLPWGTWDTPSGLFSSLKIYQNLPRCTGWLRVCHPFYSSAPSFQGYKWSILGLSFVFWQYITCLVYLGMNPASGSTCIWFRYLDKTLKCIVKQDSWSYWDRMNTFCMQELMNSKY